MPIPDDRLETVERTLNKAYGDITRDLAVVRGFAEDSTKRLAHQETTSDEHMRILRDHTARLDRIETMLSQILTHLKEMPAASLDAHENANSETVRPEEVQPKRERTFFERLMGFYPDGTGA